jgi:predicted phage-related endonuclease
MTLLDRKTYIGGSDAAAILGVSPWATPLKTYFQKIGDTLPEDMIDDPARERLFKRGKLMEPVIIEMLIDAHPIKITKRSTPKEPNRYVDQELDFMAAEIDAEWEVTKEIVDHFAANEYHIDPALIGTTQNIEVKSMAPFVAWKKLGEEGTDEIPVDYFAQAMHGLMVTRRQLTLFVVGSGWDPLIYWVKRDEETITGMREKETRFWIDNVIARVPPPVANLPDVYRMLKRRLATKLEATPEIASLIQTLKVLTNRRGMTEDAIDAVQYEIGCGLLGAEAMNAPPKKEVGKHVVMVGGQPALTIAYQEQERIDAELLRARYPAAAEECKKVSKFFKFTLKRSAS